MRRVGHHVGCTSGCQAVGGDAVVSEFTTVHAASEKRHEVGLSRWHQTPPRVAPGARRVQGGEGTRAPAGAAGTQASSVWSS